MGFFKEIVEGIGNGFFFDMRLGFFVYTGILRYWFLFYEEISSKIDSLKKDIVF